MFKYIRWLVLLFRLGQILQTLTVNYRFGPEIHSYGSLKPTFLGVCALRLDHTFVLSGARGALQTHFDHLRFSELLDCLLELIVFNILNDRLSRFHMHLIHLISSFF
jgi:hypothetical protein